jgi:hypothetical protein
MKLFAGAIRVRHEYQLVARGWWFLAGGGWWLSVVGGSWLVVRGGWWLVARGWWFVAKFVAVQNNSQLQFPFGSWQLGVGT